MAYEENDYVSAILGGAYLHDHIVVDAGGPKLFAFNQYVADMELSGWKFTTLIKAPKPGPQEPGYYLDDKLDLWEQGSGLFIRLGDMHEYDEATDNKLLFTKLEVAAETAEKIATYFEAVSWPDAAKRIREEFI